jgi:mevalonate kinase
MAHDAENLLHGRSSGVDNAVASINKPIINKSGMPPEISALQAPEPITLAVGLSHQESFTAPMVSKVREAWQTDKHYHEGVFIEIDHLVTESASAINRFDSDRLGLMMKENHRLLKIIGVSTAEPDKMVQVALDYGALGGKLTGGGGGGSMSDLDKELTERPESFTPWFKLEWERLRHHPLVEQYQRQTFISG